MQITVDQWLKTRHIKTSISIIETEAFRSRIQGQIRTIYSDSGARSEVSGSVYEEGSDASLSDGRHSSDEGFKDALDHLPESRDDAMHVGARDLAA
ncbi:hypothetical protein CPLU01_14256 [Colletotrichum plurivorum]|uniref:Uncharacterized protein n=1 Tax=Colletotrichum plurivorum TaxID=2175906 RepID=A0A8H6JKR0_9PEZI|nr:hypothetical protein CPLU01_14256 [Colletotrichum plurivorum]